MAVGCADGPKQRAYISKENTSAPTVSIDALMLSCAIDAQERRSVMTADTPCAFMQADIEEILDDLPADMDGEAVTPATNHLFQFNDSCTKLDKGTAESFTPMLSNCCSCTNVLVPTYQPRSRFSRLE